MCECNARHKPGVPLLVVLLALLAAAAGPLRARTPAPLVPPTQGATIATDPSFRELKGGLLPGIPELPAYPGATLVGSAERNRPDEPNRGYRIKWTTGDSPVQVMAWYANALPLNGWTRVPSDQPEETNELEMDIANPGFTGYIEADTGDDAPITEIIVVLARR
jgi:hypothetical protein